MHTVNVKNNRDEVLAGDIELLGDLLVEGDTVLSNVQLEGDVVLENAIAVSLPTLNASHVALLPVTVGNSTYYIKIFTVQ